MQQSTFSLRSCAPCASVSSAVKFLVIKNTLNRIRNIDNVLIFDTSYTTKSSFLQVQPFDILAQYNSTKFICLNANMQWVW